MEQDPGFLDALVNFFMDTGVLWISAILLYIFYKILKHFQYHKKLVEKEWILLEIRIPKEISKSPAAMEVVLAVFNRDDTWFSLELAAVGGSGIGSISLANLQASTT